MRAQGKSVVHVHNSDIAEVQICYPVPDEQNLFSTLFIRLDSLIALHQRKLDKLTKVKKSLLEKMFPKPGSDVPEIRFAGFTDPWEQRQLGEIASIVGGGTPDTTNPKYWDGDIDWYSPGELEGKVFLSGSSRRISREGLDNSSARLLPAGRTVLFTSRASIGLTALLTRPACTNQGFQSIVVNPDADTYFVFSMTRKIKAYAEEKAAGSTFLEVSGRQLVMMDLSLPGPKEQARVSSVFAGLDRLIALHQRKLDMLGNVKKSLLEKMFV
ncbi:hypothetical protein HMPREF3174_07990 [Trueperella sp. HMSC08H06]|nr:hypothetical protein HMPREF3174_07990 [Trueperella sp. HMSC08H06]